MVRQSVQVYLQYVRDNRVLFRFISSERAGGSRVLRLAIRHEVQRFVDDTARDLAPLEAYQGLSQASLHMVCGLMVNTLLAAAPEVLDLPADEPQSEQAMVQAHHGNNAVARATLAHARRLTGEVSALAPWFQVLGRTLQATASTHLGDVPTARLLIREARQLLDAGAPSPFLSRAAFCKMGL